jgi:hypothetical protein
VTLISYIGRPKVKGKLFGIAGAFLTLAIPYIIMLLNDNNQIETAQSLCPFKMLTGFPCPGCGITKSLIFLYEGDFLKSIFYHLFGPIVFLFCIAAIVVLILELITKREYFQSILYSKKIAYFLGFTLAIYHFGRIIYFVSVNNLSEILQQSIWR